MVEKSPKLILFAFIAFLTLIMPFLHSTALNWAPFENEKIFWTLLTSCCTFVFFLLIDLNKPLKFEINSWIVLLFAFSFSMLTSSLLGVDPQISFLGLDSIPTGSFITIFPIILIAIFLFQKRTLVSQKTIFNLVLLSGTLMSLYGILQHFGLEFASWKNDYKEYYLRVFGTIGNPIQYGMYVGAISMLALSRFFNSKNRLKFYGYYLLFSLTTLALLYSGSRAPILLQTIAMAPLCVLTITLRRHISYWKLKIFLVFFAMITLHALNYLENSNNAFAGRLGSSGVQSGLKVRVIVWEAGLQAGLKRPLFGYGPENFTHAYASVRPGSDNNYQNWNELMTKAHNEFVQLWVTQGSLGVVIFLFILALFILCFYKDYFSKNDLSAEQKLIKMGAFSAGIFLLLTNLFVFNLMPTLILLVFISTFIFNENTPQFLWIRSKQYALNRIALANFVRIGLVLTLIASTMYANSYVRASIDYGTGYFLSRSRNQLAALEKVVDAINRFPEQSRFHCIYAQLISKLLGDTKATPDELKIFTEQFEIAISACVKNGKSNDYNSWYYGAGILHDIRKLDPKYLTKAAEYFKKTIELNPTHVISYVQLGLIQSYSKNFDAAFALYNKAIDLKPDFLEAYTAMMETAYQGERIESVQELIKRLEKTDLSQSVYQHQDYYSRQMLNLAIRNKDFLAEKQLRAWILEQKKRGI